MNKEEIKKQIAVLEILNEEMPFKYPKGSSIVLTETLFMEHKEVEEYKLLPKRYHCCWYDKVGVGFPLRNIVSRPLEWMNLTEEEARKIASMFDNPIIIGFERVGHGFKD